MFRRVIVAFMLITLWGGSAMAAPGAFQPKMVYPVSLDQAWSAVISTLRENDFVVASAQKDLLQITSDYSPTSARSVGGGTLGTYLTRRKYIIIFDPKGEQTKVNIKVVIEGSLAAGGLADASSTQFMDVTNINASAALVYRDWLYEKLEPAMIPPPGHVAAN